MIVCVCIVWCWRYNDDQCLFFFVEYKPSLKCMTYITFIVWPGKGCVSGAKEKSTTQKWNCENVIIVCECFWREQLAILCSSAGEIASSKAGRTVKVIAPTSIKINWDKNIWDTNPMLVYFNYVTKLIGLIW